MANIHIADAAVGDHPAKVISITGARSNLPDLIIALHEELERSKPARNDWAMVRLPRCMPRAAKSCVTALLRGHFRVVGQQTQATGAYRIVYSAHRNVRERYQFVLNDA